MMVLFTFCFSPQGVDKYESPYTISGHFSRRGLVDSKRFKCGFGLSLSVLSSLEVPISVRSDRISYSALLE